MGSLTLTTWQRRRLEQQLRPTHDARVYRRTLAVLEAARGEPVSTVARRLRVTPRVIYYWLTDYARDRVPDTLRDLDRSGRPTVLTASDRDLLRGVLGRSPQEWGYPAAQWTVPRLREYLAGRTGRRPSDDTTRRELRRLGYTWKRSRYTLDPDPGFGGKRRRIRQQIRSLPPRSAVLAEDETDLLLFPPLRAAWSPRGQPKEVMRCGRNARRVVLGAMNLTTGRRLFLPRGRQRAGDFQAFLRAAHSAYRGWHVAMLLDEDPSHTAKGSVRVAEGLGMDLLWLPKRSPKRNPMDTLWGQGKDVACADTQYATIDEQVDRVIDYLESLSAWDALHTAGVYSRDFWLKAALRKYLCGSAQLYSAGSLGVRKLSHREGYR